MGWSKDSEIKPAAAEVSRLGVEAGADGKLSSNV